MQETWLDIDETGGRYSVSTFGNVRANWSDIPRRGLPHRVRIEKITQLSAWVHTTGYLRVSLGRNNYRYVHRLVAAAFLPNPEGLPQVDHIDGNRANNQIGNLRWVTARQNALAGGKRHGWETQRVASANRRIHDAKKHEYQAMIDQGYSLRQIAKLFGTSHSAISAVMKR
jgi:hypothetical protein